MVEEGITFSDNCHAKGKKDQRGEREREGEGGVKKIWRAAARGHWKVGTCCHQRVNLLFFSYSNFTRSKVEKSILLKRTRVQQQQKQKDKIAVKSSLCLCRSILNPPILYLLFFQYFCINEGIQSDQNLDLPIGFIFNSTVAYYKVPSI